MHELRRQAIHVSGVIFAFMLVYLGTDITVSVIGTAIVVTIIIAIYRRSRKKLFWPLSMISILAKKVEAWVGRFERPGELPMTGAVTYGVGVLFTVLVFEPVIAVPAILVLAFGDATSTIIGRRWGKHKLFFNRYKSWQGSAAFFVACFIVLYFFVNPMKALGIAALVAVVESLPNIDDNVSIPIATALLLSF